MRARWGIALLLGLTAVSLALRYGTEVNRTGGRAVYTDHSMRMEIQLETDAAAIHAMEEVVLSLQATRPSGEPMSGAALRIRVSMPDMLCGILPGEAVETAPGVYQITVLPVMSGRWQTEALLSWQESVGAVTAAFDVR